MQNKLTEELSGVSRVPALCYLEPDKSLAETPLKEYEVLPHEPMHDVAGHINNLLDEMPHHLEKPSAKECASKSATARKGMPKLWTTKAKKSQQSIGSAKNVKKSKPKPKQSPNANLAKEFHENIGIGIQWKRS